MADEILATPEILQIRSDAIIASMQHMVEAGLKPENILELERQRPTDHRDFLMLYLGLKPYANFLDAVVDCYDGYFDLFPGSLQTGVQVTIPRDIEKYCDAWNYPLLKSVLSEISDDLLVFPLCTIHGPLDDMQENARLKLSWLMNTPADNNDPEFFVRVFIREFVNSRTYPNFPLEAVVFGYPVVAGELFGKNHLVMIEEADRLWRQAEEDGMQLELECPTAPLHLTQNRDGCRTEFVMLAEKLGCDPNLLDFVKHMRSADVPGYPYLTSGDLTKDEECRLTELYGSSALDGKLKNFLEQFGAE